MMSDLAWCLGVLRGQQDLPGNLFVFPSLWVQLPSCDHTSHVHHPPVLHICENVFLKPEQAAGDAGHSGIVEYREMTSAVLLRWRNWWSSSSWSLKDTIFDSKVSQINTSYHVSASHISSQQFLTYQRTGMHRVGLVQCFSVVWEVLGASHQLPHDL